MNGDDVDLEVPDGAVVPDCCETVKRTMSVLLGFQNVGEQWEPRWKIRENIEEILRRYDLEEQAKILF